MRECPEAACALLDYCSLKPKVMLPGCSWNKAEPNLIGFLMFLTMVSSAETQEWSQSIAHSSGLGGSIFCAVETYSLSSPPHSCRPNKMRSASPREHGRRVCKNRSIYKMICWHFGAISSCSNFAIASKFVFRLSCLSLASPLFESVGRDGFRTFDHSGLPQGS